MGSAIAVAATLKKLINNENSPEFFTVDCLGNLAQGYLPNYDSIGEPTWHSVASEGAVGTSLRLRKMLIIPRAIAYRIYLDVCCLNRPLDDASQERIRLEAKAVLLIYRKCRMAEWQLGPGEVIDLEISRTKNRQRRDLLQVAVAIAYNQIILDEEVRQRAAQIGQLGFQPFDAAHLASAEAGDATIFLTTDDRLLRRAIRFSDQLNITVKNPATWLIEINQLQESAENDDTL